MIRVKTLTLIYTSGYINDEQLPKVSKHFIKVATEAYFKFYEAKGADKILFSKTISSEQ